MSLTQFLRTLWARRWVAVVCTASCFAAGIIAVSILPKSYKAQSRILLNVVSADPVSGAAIAPNFARAYIPTQTELMRDYRVAGRVVDRLGWTKDAALRAEYEASGERTLDFRRWLAQGVSGATDAFAVEGSNIIVIEYSDGDPQRAAKLADAVRDAYIEETLAFKRESARNAATWFEGQSQKVRAQLQQAEQRKAAFERANDIILLDDGTDADTARMTSIAGSIDTPTVTSTAGPNPAAAQLAQIDAQIQAESQTLGPNHPTIQRLREQRNAVAAASRGGAPRPVVSGPSISSQVAGARAKVLAQRGKVEEARRLFTDAKVLKDQYDKVVARASDFRQQAGSNESGVTLLDSALPPSRPSSPKVPQILIGSLAMGLVLGLLISLIIELLFRRVRSAEDLKVLHVPVIGVISGKIEQALLA